jgi:hypothetical protein
MSFPGKGLKLLLNANNVDGARNVLLDHGDSVPSWKTQGDGSVADFTQSVPRWRPVLKKPTTAQGDVAAVSFDGVFNTLLSAGSSSALAFVHQTGVFSLVLALRRRGGTVSNPRRVFGNEIGKGLILLHDDTDHTENGWFASLTTDGGTTTLHTDLVPPLGAWSKVLIQGDGVNLSISTDFYSFLSTPITGLPGTGSAGADYSVGCANPTPAATTAPPCDDDLGVVALYNRVLALDERLTIRADMTAQFGGSL